MRPISNLLAMLNERSIDDVVATVRRARDNGVACTLLIGAGCSVTAGIPTAEGFVRIIEKNFPFRLSTIRNKDLLRLHVSTLHRGAASAKSAAFEQALTKLDKEADKLFRLANERFEGTIRIKSDMYQAVAMWGLSLFEQAKRKKGREADDLCVQ